MSNINEMGDNMAISVQLALILLLLFVFNFYCINCNKWSPVFICLFSLLLLIPTDGQGLISGTAYNVSGVFNISLIGYDVIIVYFCIILLRRKLKNISKTNFASIILCLMLIISIRFLVDGFDAPSNKMFDNYGLPILMAIFIVSFLSKESLPQILKCIYIIILFNAVVACVEYVIGQSAVFHNYYMDTVSWYKSIYISTKYGVRFRSTAFLGHPLTNGTYYLLAVVYLYNSRKGKNVVFSAAQFVVLAFAILTTNSRTDMLIFAAYTAFFLLKSKDYIKCSILAFVCIFALGTIDFASIYDNLFSRDATGSSVAVRILAINSIFKIPFLTFLFGTGYNNTSSLLSQLGFTANLEISYFIILLENGILGFIVWLRTMALFYRSKIDCNLFGVNYKSMLNGMLVCFLVVAAASNSIGDPGTLNYMLWGLLSFTNVAARKSIH